MDYCNNEPMGPAEATEIIQGIAKLGIVKYSTHCWAESMRDRDFSFHDLIAILLNGVVRDPPEINEKTGDFKYKVIGKCIEGDEAVAITVVINHRELFVITVFPLVRWSHAKSNEMPILRLRER